MISQWTYEHSVCVYTLPHTDTQLHSEVLWGVCLGNLQRKLSIVTSVSVVGLWLREEECLLCRKLCQQHYWHVNKPQPTVSGSSASSVCIRESGPGATLSGVICNRKCLANHTAFRATNYTHSAPKYNTNSLHLWGSYTPFKHRGGFRSVYESWYKVVEVRGI